MPIVKAVPMKMPRKARRAPITNNKTQKKVAVKTKTTNRPAPAAAAGFRMQRNRVQTKLYQAPDATVRQLVTKTSAVAKKKTATTAKKILKGKKVAVTKTIPKVKKMTKKEVAREKAKQVARKGNERLKKRDGITIDKENPFFVSGAAPDFVSVSTYHRWLIRALVRKNVNELKTLFKNKKFNAQSFGKVFSYADGRSSDGLICLTGDVKLIEEYYKLKDSVVKEKKPVQAEPNMLQRKATGQKNFYMLGRATRQLHMSRGGREGNNAFLDYEGGTDREDSSGIEALVEANTSYQDIHKICQLKESGMQTHFLDSHLVTACRRGHTELAHAIASAEAQHCTNDLVRASLKVGGKLPAKILSVSVVKKVFGNKNITPLHTAAINPDGAKMLELMRAVEPNINVADQDGWFTVHYASVCRNAEPLRYLLKNGAVPSMLNKKHQSPLHVAAIAGRADTVKVLMEAIDKLEKSDGGDDPKPEKSLLNARTRNGMTPLLLAVRNGHLDVVKTLLENNKVLVDCPASAGANKITPLMLASAKGNLEMAQLLVSKDGLVEAKDKKKRTPLIHAVLNGQEHTAAYLLSMGSDLLKGDSSGNTAAHYAAAYGWLQCLQLLADVAPDSLTAENDWKLTPLTVAFLKGHYGIVSWLLDGEHKNRVDINGKDMEGYTLLSCLLTFSDPEVHHQLPEQIEYLLKRGADCTLMDSLDNTILHDFAGLRAQIATPSRTGMTEKQYMECFMKLCDRAPDAITAKNQEGLTPLHVSLMRCNLKVFNWFLERIKDPKEFFTNTWSSQNSFLETLLQFPMESWRSGLWDSEQKPSSDLYDALPTIKNVLMKHCKAEVENWMREKDASGNYHILELAKSYQKLPSRPKSPHLKSFIAYMTTVFSWICDVFPEALALQSEMEGGQLGSTLLSYVINGPSDVNNMLLLSLLQKAVDHKIIGKVLCQEVLDVPFSILALQSNSNTLKAILDFSAKNKCTEGVHNAVLKKIKEGDVEKEVNKTLLMLIIGQNEFDLVRDLVLSPDEWKAKDADGNSAWHAAAKSNHHRTLVLMKNLEAKKVPREANNRGATPLHVAVQACDGSANSVMEPIEWLVTKSNVADQDHFGRTAMHYAFASFLELEEKRYGATMKDPIAVVSILAMGITEQQLNISDVDGNTALHLAAAAGANICAVTLLRKGAKVDVKNKDGNTPLALAVLNARQGVALTLIQANSCVTDKVVLANHKKEEAAVEWMWKALVEKVEEAEDSSIPAQIVNKGTDWAAMVYVLLDTLGKNTKSLAQITVCALKERQYNLANQLLKSLEALLDGNTLETEEDLVLIFAEYLPGETPMLLETVERTVLERLLALGCPLQKNGACPAFEVALKNSAWRLAFYFKDKMGSAWGKLKAAKEDEGPLHALLTGGNLKQEAYGEWLKQLMELKQLSATSCSLSLPVPSVVSGAVEGKFTALGWAALSANIPLIELLRRKGFDVNVADEHGRTPLMFAVLSNDEETVEAICGDLSVAGPTKHVPHKKAQNGVRTTTNFSKHLAVRSARARKRKADDSEEEDEDDDADDDEESGSGSGSGSEDEEENNNEPKKQPLAKRFKIANKQLSLEAKDNNGRNLFHYLCEPISWENVEMFKLIAREQKNVTKRLLVEKDNDGVTPQALAVKRQMRQLATAMAQITGQNEKVPSTDLPSVKELTTKFDITADSKAFMEKFAAENDKKKSAKAADADKPCNLSGYKDSGIVEKCSETGQYFRVLLNKSDLSYGRYGFHNFYRMELIKRRDADLWNLFTNWGRIGDNNGTGEFQSTPFGTLEAGIKEFKSVFKSKAGQEWLKLENFVDMPKKYRLVKIDTSPSSLAEVELPPYPKEAEKDAVRAFVKDISDPKKLKEYQSNVYRRLNISCPFGRITQEAIDKAREILEDCRLVSKQMTATIEAVGTTNTEKLVRLINQANDLSSEFYSVIPMGNAEFSALTRLDSDHTIENALVTLNRMSEVEIATRILTAAARHPEVDRIDYVQSSIECGLRAMRPDEEFSQNILQWIHNTGGDLPKGSVKGIIEVTPMRSVEAFAKFANEDYHKFLFHGTRAANLASLLRDGFVVDPQNANINGRLFGDGIYLADCFIKSNSYCEVSARGWKYMLICQVAMGKTAVRDINKYEEENLTKLNLDVVHMEGRVRPRNCTVDGVVMPLGKPKKNQENYWFGQHSEYIVRDPKRVLPRFIVMYEYE